MAIFRYLTHPQVVIDPKIDAKTWPLSGLGIERARTCAQAIALSDTTRLLTSFETKAQQTADILGDGLELTPELIAQTQEADRSATGYLPDEDFDAAIDQFYAQPGISVRGWETADTAQARIVSCVFQAIMTMGNSGDVLCVGHGTVGTLLYCHLMDLPIARQHDQPLGGGNLFTFDMESDEVIHGWMPIETFSGLTGLAI